MIYTKFTRLALQIAYKAHEGQLDKSGLPYIFHPYHVAEQMTDEITACIALLHDVIEDTPMTIEELAAYGFPEEVIEGVRLMTHAKDVDYFDYVLKIKENPNATAVKLADLAHNSDTSRMDTVTEHDMERLQKYKKARELLLS